MNTTTNNSMIAKMIIGCANVYGRQVTDGLVGVWVQQLASYTDSEVAEAFKSYMRIGSKFPVPADIHKLINGNPEEQALAAWSKVDRAIRTVGIYRDVVFDEPKIHKIIFEMGGWIDLCKTESEEKLTWYKLEFVKRYSGMGLKAGNYPAILRGLTNHQNETGLHTKHLEPPVMIGDDLKCQRVMSYKPNHANREKLKSIIRENLHESSSAS